MDTKYKCLPAYSAPELEASLNAAFRQGYRILVTTVTTSEYSDAPLGIVIMENPLVSRGDLMQEASSTSTAAPPSPPPATSGLSKDK